MSEIHISVGRFKDLLKYIQSNNGSISGIDSFPIDIFYDYVIIDYDKLDAQPVINFIQAMEKIFNVNPQNICVYFSGNKGFHIYIPSVLMIVKPSVDLNIKVSEFAKLITDGFFEIDTNIYRKGSTIRLPNTLNTKSGLYKIPVYLNELYNIDEIKKLAQKPRYEKTFEYPKFTNMKLSEFFNNIKISNVKKYNNIKDISTTVTENKFIKKCIINMLKGGGKDERGGRKNIAFRLAVHFYEQGYPINITEAIMVEWNKHNSPPLDNHIISSVIRSAYTHYYSFGCNDIVKQYNCDKTCYLYKYKQ